jgi:hypothetical protein
MTAAGVELNPKTGAEAGPSSKPFFDNDESDGNDKVMIKAQVSKVMDDQK